MSCRHSVHRRAVFLAGNSFVFQTDLGMKLRTACFCPQSSETPRVLKRKVESAFELYLKAEFRIMLFKPTQNSRMKETGKPPEGRKEKLEQQEHHYPWWQMFTKGP